MGETYTITGGIYNGIIMTPPIPVTPFGNPGIGIYVDGQGNGYLQLYWGTPINSASWGYADNVKQFLTGASFYGALGDGSFRLGLGGNASGVAVGVGTPGFGLTYGIPLGNLPSYISPFLPSLGVPLVLDLAGSGIQLTPVTDSQVYFDFTESGFATKTGWILPTEGFLVVDDGNSNSVTADNLLGAQSGDGFPHRLTRMASPRPGAPSA